MSHNVSDRANNDHLHWSRNAHRSSPPERDRRSLERSSEARLAGRRHPHQGYKGTKRRWPRRRAYFSFWESSGSAWQHGLAAFDFVAMPEVSHALRHKTPQLSKCKLTTANLATPCLGTIVHQYLGSYRDNR
jgi:hypothetical protein